MISRRKFINLSIASFVIPSSKETFAEGKKIKKYILLANPTEYLFSNDEKLTKL